MTDNKDCPLCGTELEENPVLEGLSCPDCAYTDSGNMLLGEKQIIYRLAEILEEVAEGILNVNTDDEIEELEQQIQQCKNLLQMMKEKDSTSPFDDVDEPTYPSPQPPHKPYKPYPIGGGDTFWQKPKQGNEWTTIIDSNTSTSDKLDTLSDIVERKISND